MLRSPSATYFGTGTQRVSPTCLNFTMTRTAAVQIHVRFTAVNRSAIKVKQGSCESSRNGVGCLEIGHYLHIYCVLMPVYRGKPFTREVKEASWVAASVPRKRLGS